MSINQNHPSYERFIKNEIKTLDFIKDQSFLENSFLNLTSTAKMFSDGFRGIKPKDLKSKPLDFECELELLVEKKPRRVFIGAKATPGFSHVSYMLAICESNQNNKELIRKFHFDYAIKVKKQADKPIYHLQYGGEESPMLSKEGISANKLHPKISAPRLFSPPINLALILDMIFSEFESAETVKIIMKPEWTDFIKFNEDFLLRPYYARVRDFFEHKEHSSGRLLRDFCYGR